MNRGIYITANDRVLDQAIALLNSIRLHDSETPIVLIPYDDQFQKVADVLNQRFGVRVYENLEFIERLSKNLQGIFGDRFFARPNQFRKQACWFGPFDQFLYLDTDVIVFEKIIDNLNWLETYDFICCDYQRKGGIKNVFSPQILADKIFTDLEVQDIFNCGFWASKKHLICEADLYETFSECATHPEYFDFSQKTSDQPIINYLILKRIPNRFNLTHQPNCPGSWAGSQFQREGDRLIDSNCHKPLQYLHWAGFRIQSGCPYWDLWQHYRYLNESMPQPPTWPQQIRSFFKLT